jgi:hypothetical protein
MKHLDGTFAGELQTKNIINFFAGFSNILLLRRGIGWKKIQGVPGLGQLTYSG